MARSAPRQAWRSHRAAPPARTSATSRSSTTSTGWRSLRSSVIASGCRSSWRTTTAAASSRPSRTRTTRRHSSGCSAHPSAPTSRRSARATAFSIGRSSWPTCPTRWPTSLAASPWWRSPPAVRTLLGSTPASDLREGAIDPTARVALWRFPTLAVGSQVVGGLGACARIGNLEGAGRIWPWPSSYGRWRGSGLQRPEYRSQLRFGLGQLGGRDGVGHDAAAGVRGQLTLARTDPAPQRDPDLPVAGRIDPADPTRVHAAIHALDLVDECQRRFPRRPAHGRRRVKGCGKVEHAAARDRDAHVGRQVPYV